MNRGQGSNGKICIIPNPAEAGSTVEIVYVGDGGLSVRAFGGEDWEDVAIDPETGVGTFQVPLEAPLILVFSDRERPVPSEEILEVQESRP